MAQDGEVNVKVKVTAENGGVTKVENGLDKIEKKAKKTAEATKSGLEQANQSFGKATKAAQMFQKALTGFGVIGMLTGLIEGIKSIADSFKAAKKEAEEFKKSAAEKQIKDDIDDLAKSYDALTDAITKANNARTHQNELEDIELKNARDLEDANIDLAEQKELAEVDEKDPAAAEVRAEIQARYKAKRDNLAVQRGVFDGVRERQNLQQGAISDRADADKIDSAAAELDKQIKEAEARKADATYRSTAENKEDHGVIGQFGRNLKNTLTLNWGADYSDNRSEAGNAIREEAKQEAEREQTRIDELKAKKEAQLKQSAALREQADQKDAKAKALGGSVEAQRVREQVVSMQGTASVAAAVRATDAKDREVAAKSKEVSDAITAQELLEREKAEVKGKISAAEARKAAAAQSVYDAQGNLDLAKANGKGTVGAQQALISAQRAADGVNREADAAIAAFSESLKSIESKLNIAARIIQQSSKQNNNLFAEMPSGE